MAPNLAVLAITLFSPHRWFSSSKKQTARSGSPTNGPLAIIEHWKSPVPGTYQHRPGAGWFLIQRDGEDSRLESPDKVVWSDALDRKLLLSDYQARSKKGKLPMVVRPPQSRNNSAVKVNQTSKEKESFEKKRSPKMDAAERPEVYFVRHEDGVTWLNDRDEKGMPTKGPWQRFCIDKDTGGFRPMLIGDDPKRSRPSSERSKSVSTCGASTESSGDGKRAQMENAVRRSSSTTKSVAKSGPPTPKMLSKLSQQAPMVNMQSE